MEENSKKQKNMQAVKLSVPHILGPLFLMFIGYVLALTVFLIEIFWEKHLKKVALRKKLVNTWKKRIN